MGSLPLPVRLARRDLRRHPRRAIALILLLALPMAVGSFLLTYWASAPMSTDAWIRLSVGSEAEAYLEVHDTAVEQNAAGTLIEVGDGTVPPREELLDRVEGALPENARMEPFTSVDASLHSQSRLMEGVPILEYDPMAVPGRFEIVSGSTASAPFEAVLSANAASELGVQPGDTLELSGESWSLTLTVSGIASNVMSISDVVVAPGTLPSDLPGGGWFVFDAAVPAAAIAELNPVGIQVISREVIASVAQRDLTPDEYTASTTPGLFAAVSALGLLEVLLVVGPAFAIGMRRRARELALIAGNGARPADLHRIVYASALFHAAIASAVGATVGILGGWALVRASRTWLTPALGFAIPWGLIGLLVLLTLAIGLATASVPALSAARRSVTALLGGHRADSSVRARVPLWVLAVLGAGVAATAVGLSSGASVVFGSGLALMLLGVIASSSIIVTLIGRLASRSPLAARIALRDAARATYRTAPALATVIITVAVAVAALTQAWSLQASYRATDVPLAASGVLSVSLGTEFDVDPQSARVTADAALETTREAFPEADIAVLAGIPHDTEPSVYLLASPENHCEQVPTDARCLSGATSYLNIAPAVAVDDGSALRALGLPGADSAAAALAEGVAVVTNPDHLWDDGTAHISVDGATMIVPAVFVDWPRHSIELALPPDLADDIGAEAVPQSLVVSGLESFVEEDELVLTQELALGVPSAHAHLHGTSSAPVPFEELIVAAGCVLVALAAVTLSVSLTASESRPDLATMVAAGASPSIRRRVSGAHGLALALPGVLIGLTLGVATSVVLARWQTAFSQFGDFWTVSVPRWPILAVACVIPVVGWTVGLLSSGGKLSLTR